MLRRGNGQADRQACLADAWRTEDDQILLALQEAELMQRLNLLR